MWRLLPFFIALAACSSYAPRPLDEAAVLEDLRRVQVEIPAEGLSSDQAVVLALIHNPMMALQRRRHEIAAGLVLSEAAWKNPEFRPSLQDTYSRAANPLTFALDLRIFPPVPGEAAARKARAEARERRVLAEIEDGEKDLAVRTRIAHARLVMLDEKLRIADEISRIHKRIDAIVNEQIEAGAATLVDGTLIQLQREEIADAAQALAGEREAAEADLASILGAALTARIKVMSSASRAARTRPPEQSALEDRALAGRSDLRALKERYEEAERKLELVHISHSFWPRFLEIAAGGLPRDSSLGLDGGIALPIFDDGSADIAVAESRREKARDAFRAALHEVRAELRQAALEMLEQARRRQFLNKSLNPALVRAEGLLRGILEYGAVDPLKLVDIESRLWKARSEGAEATFAYERSRIKLAAAMGSVFDKP